MCVCDVSLIERKREQIKGACVFGEKRANSECEEGVPKVFQRGRHTLCLCKCLQSLMTHTRTHSERHAQNHSGQDAGRHTCVGLSAEVLLTCRWFIN